MTAVHGACLCGTVSFAVAPSYAWFAHCHCAMCRKHLGAAFGTGFGVARARFSWLTGETAIVHYRSSTAFERSFCGICGSSVPAASHAADALHVPAGLMADDPGERPRTHIFVDSKLASVVLDDALPQFATYPPGIDLPTLATRAPESATAALSGSCLCGAVAYEASALPRHIVNCYCSLCRRSRAAAFSSTLAVPVAALRWIRGSDCARSYALPAPHAYAVDFCQRCGSLVPTAVASLGLAFVPVGSVDTELPALPMTHTYVASRARWVEIHDAGPQFAALPPPELGQLLL